MEGFVEQVVKRDKTMKSLTIKILAVALLVIIPVTLFMLSVYWGYLAMVAIFLIIGGVYVVWYVFSCQKVEYEYAVNGDTLDISKIIALRKRKRVCSVPIKDIEVLEKGDKNIKDRGFVRVYNAAKNPNDVKENHFAVWRVAGKGSCLLVFNPNEDIILAMKPYMDRDLMIKLFYKNRQG